MRFLSAVPLSSVIIETCGEEWENKGLFSRGKNNTLMNHLVSSAEERGY